MCDKNMTLDLFALFEIPKNFCLKEDKYIFASKKRKMKMQLDLLSYLKLIIVLKNVPPFIVNLRYEDILNTTF